MPTAGDQLPGDATALARRLAALEREVRELRAARRAEFTAVGSGGITVQAPGDNRRITIRPTSEIALGSGGPPPAIEFWSGAAEELEPGFVAAYTADGGYGPLPTVLLSTSDLGDGLSFFKLQSGNAQGDQPAALISVGGAELILSNSVFYVLLAGGGLAFDGSGASLQGESWQSLPMAGGWTAYGSTYQSPLFQKKVDGMVQLTGLIAPGTTTSGTTVANLPTGYRPSADHIFHVSGGAGTASADVYVRSSGAVSIQNTAGTITWLSLSGIRFPL